MEVTDDYAHKAELIVRSLKQRGVNFLAIDFDLTMVNCHTGGRWQGSTADLASKVRPIFRSLIPLAIQQRNFFLLQVLHTLLNVHLFQKSWSQL